MEKYGILLTYCAAFLLAGIATGMLTPVAVRLARRFNVVDKPGYRKVHSKVIPRLGGVAVFSGILLTFLTLGLFSQTVRELIAPNIKAFLCLGGGALLLFLVGLRDDIAGVSPRTKLFFQMIAGMLAAYGGFQFQLFGADPQAAGGSTWALVISLLLTVIWTIGTTNALNLIDGLDGLASGITGIALTMLGIISIGNNHAATAFTAFIAAGASFGFLFHNRHPAKIFLGDSGSLFLGFLLSALTIQGTRQGSLVASLVGPLCLLYIPLLDTFLAIVRRTQKGLPFSHADNHHIHHRLLGHGIHHPHVVLILWGTAAAVGSLALLLHFVENAYKVLLVNVFAATLLALTVRYLGSLELFAYFRSLRNINRRKRTPREKILSLRRDLVEMEKGLTAESVLRKATGIAHSLGLDSLAIYMAPVTHEAARTLVFRWDRHLQLTDGNKDWVAEPPEMVQVAASTQYGKKPVSCITLELGSQLWKQRRKSEDMQLWTKLILETLATIQVLSIFCPGETQVNQPQYAVQ